MRNLLSASTLLALSLSLAAQNQEWVTNGGFDGTLTPWVLGGAYSVNPGLEIGWNTTGMGASDSFGVNAGGQTTPSPYPPNTLEQDILVIQGLTYEFRCDASGARPAAPTVGNADIGTIWVEVDNVEVARFAFGSYVVGQTKRAQIVGRFSPQTTGFVPLRIFFQRQFLGGAANPRMNIDNVSVKDVVGPTYWIQGNRPLGVTQSHQIRGEANALFATFTALGEFPTGAAFPGIGGLWFLDLGTTTTLAFGTTDNNGAGAASLAIPNNPLFLSTPLYYQAGTWASQLNFGYQFGVVCTQ